MQGSSLNLFAYRPKISNAQLLLPGLPRTRIVRRAPTGSNSTEHRSDWLAPCIVRFVGVQSYNCPSRCHTCRRPCTSLDLRVRVSFRYRYRSGIQLLHTSRSSSLVSYRMVARISRIHHSPASRLLFGWTSQEDSSPSCLSTRAFWVG